VRWCSQSSLNTFDDGSPCSKEIGEIGKKKEICFRVRSVHSTGWI
jgi:hypothetical protein